MPVIDCLAQFVLDLVQRGKRGCEKIRDVSVRPSAETLGDVSPRRPGSISEFVTQIAIAVERQPRGETKYFLLKSSSELPASQLRKFPDAHAADPCMFGSDFEAPVS